MLAKVRRVQAYDETLVQISELQNEIRSFNLRLSECLTDMMFGAYALLHLLGRFEFYVLYTLKYDAYIEHLISQDVIAEKEEGGLFPTLNYF